MSELQPNIFQRHETKYFDRLGIAGSVAVNEESLHILHRAHLEHIPFENFDIQAGFDINLETEHLFHKLLCQHRGGYCFELNSLLQTALIAMGYRLNPVLARVHRGTPGGLTHLVGICSLGNHEWLIDTGFGGEGLRKPVIIETGRINHQDGESFRITLSADFGYILQKQIDGSWHDLYSFERRTVHDIDLQIGNHYCSSHPDSFFVTSRMANILRPDGRASLHNFDLKITAGGQVSFHKLEPGQDYLDALQTYFGIYLPWDYTRLKAVKA